MTDDITDPTPDYSGSGPVIYSPSGVAPAGAVAEVLAAAEPWLMSIPGVTSVGLGNGPTGGEAVVVGVTDAGVAGQLPPTIKGVPVVVTITGEVEALPHR